MVDILIKIKSQLKKSSDKKSFDGFNRFFKEPIKCYGVKVPEVRKIAAEFWKEIKSFNKKEVFTLCEELLKSDYCEEAFIVADWLPRVSDKFEIDDICFFERWIDQYINNWAKCDSFCNHTMGDYLFKFPGQVKVMKRWAKSKNRWMKRASAVSLIVPAKRGLFLNDVLEIADILLIDTDDMVQKGYGWMLKEASRKHEKEVFNYVMKNKKTMPRTALRYAIELMPKSLKIKAMEK